MALTKVGKEGITGISNSSDATAITIDSSENVGVGNTTPSSFYSLADNLVVGTGSGGHGLTIYSGSSDSGYIGFNDTASASMQGFIQYNHNGDYMAFAPNGSERMRIDANGHVTMPHQSAFSASPSPNLENFAINQYNNVNFNSERFDRNADYNAGGSPSTFTAPVTGIYQLNFHLYILSLDTAATYVQYSILTSNKEYTSIIDPNFSGDLGYYHMVLSVAADMDANDSAYVRVYQQGGSAQMDVAGNSHFSGYLVC
tara:strand:- start:374 stop:1144 length:771 start_codon:yes stop_codon:yes gene_type:complete